MSEQNPIFWDGEQHDPSEVGRGVPGVDRPERIGCALIGLEILAGVVLAVTGPLSALASLGIAAAAVVATLIGIDIASKTERGLPNPAGYAQRAGWTAHDPRPDCLEGARLLGSRTDPSLQSAPGFPGGVTLCASVTRTGGTGEVTMTQPTAQAPAAPRQMMVWVGLDQPLPGLQVFTISDRGRFTSESIEFNERYAVAPWPVGGVAAWNDNEFARYSSDLLTPQVMRELVAAFHGFPDLLVRDRFLGAAVEPTEPYRAELALDVLLAVRRHLPEHLAARYSHRTALERAASGGEQQT